jgi:hypothetical protein
LAINTIRVLAVSPSSPAMALCERRTANRAIGFRMF